MRWCGQPQSANDVGTEMTTDKLTLRLASLSPAKRALLELKLQQGRAGLPGNMTIWDRQLEMADKATRALVSSIVPESPNG